MQPLTTPGIFPQANAAKYRGASIVEATTSRSAKWFLPPCPIISLPLRVPLAVMEVEAAARPCVDVAHVHSCRSGHGEPAGGNDAAGVDSGGGIVAVANRTLHASVSLHI